MKAAALARRELITDADFLKFRDFFYRKTGIYFDDSKRYFVDKRLVERIEATGADDFRSYFIALRFESRGEELQQLKQRFPNEPYIGFAADLALNRIREA